MKGISVWLRLGLLALAAALAMGGLGSVSLARDAFDSDYEDCPVRTRLDAIDGLTVDRTDDADKIRVSWNALDVPALGLANNAYSARITVIVDGEKENLALGDTSVEFKEVSFHKDLTVSAALTIGKMVISDIAEADFTSGLPAPSFSGVIKALVGGDGTGFKVETTGDFGTDQTTPLATSDNALKLKSLTFPHVTKENSSDAMEFGEFYYLGFNSMFDNWFVKDKSTAVGGFGSEKPATNKFRVGLRHGGDGLMPADADFDHFRITIEDSNGDLLGYNAQTVSAASRYGNFLGIVLGEVGATNSGTDLSDVTKFANVCAYPGTLGADVKLTNVRLSTEATGGPRAPYYQQELTAFCDSTTAGTVESAINEGDDRMRSFASPGGIKNDLTMAWTWPGAITDGTEVRATDVSIATLQGIYYAPDPEEYYDFPVDVFGRDGNYTFKAWAEDDDGVRISPQSSITLNVAYRIDSAESGYQGYVTGTDAGATSVRTWEAEVDPITMVTVYNFAIQSN